MADQHVASVYGECIIKLVHWLVHPIDGFPAPMQPIEIEQALKSLQMVQTLMFYTESNKIPL